MFYSQEEVLTFRALLHATAARVRRRVLASCLMLHHVHLALFTWPSGARPMAISAASGRGC